MEVKTWLYREGLLEASSSSRRDRVSGESEALQRSTLHVSASDLDPSSIERIAAATAAGASVARSCDAACERGVRYLPEAKLALLEAALLNERTRLRRSAARNGGASSHGPVMGDWLKVPRLPLARNCFSFHLPLHRVLAYVNDLWALARAVLCFCPAVVPAEEREQSSNEWWRLPLCVGYASGPPTPLASPPRVGGKVN